VIAFVDTETTGLDPDRHEVWECAVVLYDPVRREEVDRRLWQVQPQNLGVAEPIALEISGFHDRYDREAALLPRFFASALTSFIPPKAHLAGAVVSFDEERLRRLVAANGLIHPWHYHLIDVEALAVGALSTEGPVALPWKSDDLSRALSVEVSEEDRHTAMGDALWALRIWQAVVEP
jgi:oligoribonuclease (3'-5' exoribonuclease)